MEALELTEYYIVRKTKIGEMAEWSIALVLKTRSLQGLRGSNPLLSSSHFSKLCYVPRQSVRLIWHELNSGGLTLGIRRGRP